MTKSARECLDVAQLYLELGSLPKAITYFLEAAETEFHEGRTDESRAILQRVLQFDPEHARAGDLLHRLDQGLPPPPRTLWHPRMRRV